MKLILSVASLLLSVAALGQINDPDTRTVGARITRFGGPFEVDSSPPGSPIVKGDLPGTKQELRPELVSTGSIT
jgi:hypothetical protein